MTTDSVSPGTRGLSAILSALDIPLRAYFSILGSLAVWSVAAVLIFMEVLSWPYLGADFDPDREGRAALVTALRSDGPAAAAGLSVGDEIVAMTGADGIRHEMTGFEAIEGREQLHSYEQSDLTQAVKAIVWDMLASGTLSVETRDGGRHEIMPAQSRPLQSLPANFFILTVQSLVVVMIAAGVLAFAPLNLPVGLLVVSGFAMAVNMMFNMLGMASELTMPDQIYAARRIIVPIAVLGFALSLLSLIWYFPEPIARFPFGPMLAVYGLFVISAQHFQFFAFPLHPYQGPLLLIMLSGVAVSVISWRRTRDKPLQRASVMWFVLSISGVTGFVTLFYNLPAFLRMEPIIGTGPALFAVTLIYVGIALGTLRYRLFDIQRIWWRTVAWAVGGLLVVVADIILVSQFDFEQAAALPMALLVSGWAYFPIRHFILEHFMTSSTVRIDPHLPRLIAAFSGLEERDEFDGRFIAFLRDVFEAQEIGPVRDERLENAVLSGNGLGLIVPDLAGDRSLAIMGKSGGRRLFSREDAVVADTFLRFVRYMAQASEREFAKLQKDRERIVRDLHDDVGAKLLSVVYNSDDPGVTERAREALSALKDSLIVIENTETVDLRDGWSQLETTMRERLKDAGFEPRIEQEITFERILSAREYMNFKRIVQEIVSNVLKHGQPGVVLLRIEVDEMGTLLFEARNRMSGTPDGTGMDSRGLANIETRLSEIGGQLIAAGPDLSEGAEFEIAFELPLDD